MPGHSAKERASLESERQCGCVRAVDRLTGYGNGAGLNRAEQREKDHMDCDAVLHCQLAGQPASRDTDVTSLTLETTTELDLLNGDSAQSRARDAVVFVPFRAMSMSPFKGLEIAEFKTFTRSRIWETGHARLRQSTGLRQPSRLRAEGAISLSTCPRNPGH